MVQLQIILANRWFVLLLAIAGVAIGIWHFGLVLPAIFLFRADEPIASWLALLLGPFSTLPAVILALFKNRVGGLWLISGGIISFISMAIAEHFNVENLIPFFIMMSAPMLTVGCIFLIKATLGKTQIKK